MIDNPHLTASSQPSYCMTLVMPVHTYKDGYLSQVQCASVCSQARAERYQ